MRKKKSSSSIKISNLKKRKKVYRKLIIPHKKSPVNIIINKWRKVSFKSFKLPKSPNKFFSRVKTFSQKKKGFIQDKRQENNGKEKKKQLIWGSENLSLNETKIDLLYKMIQEKDQVNGEEASKKLNVSLEVIMVWAKILEEHELILIKYPTFGQPFFKKGETKKEEEKNK